MTAIECGASSFGMRPTFAVATILTVTALTGCSATPPEDHAAALLDRMADGFRAFDSSLMEPNLCPGSNLGFSRMEPAALEGYGIDLPFEVSIGPIEEIAARDHAFDDYPNDERRLFEADLTIEKFTLGPDEAGIVHVRVLVEQDNACVVSMSL